jgi:hypothetical protein
MTQITIDFDPEENKNIEIFKAQEEMKNKEKAVRLIVRRFFKMEEPSEHKRWKK